MLDESESAQYGTVCESLHTSPTAPVITLEELSRRDSGGNGACEGLLLYIFTLRFQGRPAKNLVLVREREQREKGLKE